MEKKHCIGVNHGQWKISIMWVKKHGQVGRIGVLRLYKVYNFGWGQFILAVLTPNNSFVCVNSLWLLSCSTQASPLKNKNIRLYFYIYMLLVICKDPAEVYHIHDLVVWPGFCNQDASPVMFLVSSRNCSEPYGVFWNEKCICIIFLMYVYRNSQPREEITEII